ncbi:hypothetical protein M8A51_22650 [Schlegelella sp. S2-27]|uniref:PEP-CTERM protein-sorting domain-containing protein n=1 Tax=Caldimonas mangrovi TaxID=2944811 RepID=A0ABT0YWW0_9BURK|nr:PEP-CTERM sorting domain-containing protein [Caldimonas mangrovi]MCM5682338.1 hypothetical protein [Caldimonas mangrovi]
MEFRRGWEAWVLVGAVALAAVPTGAGAQSFSDGLHDRPPPSVETCVAVTACAAAPAVWEGTGTDPTPVAPGSFAAAPTGPAGVSPVPEPHRFGMMLAGLALVALIALRRRATRPVLPSLKFPL